MPNSRIHSRLISCLGALLLISAASCSRPGAYVRRGGDRWTIGTAKAEKTVALIEGRFVGTSWLDKTTGRELIPAGAAAEELRLTLDGSEITGSQGGWTLVKTSSETLGQGEKRLEITVRRGGLEAAKSFVAYPGSSILREYVRFTNAGTGPLRVAEPGFLDLTALTGSPEAEDFYWMTGGESRAGSWALRKERLKAGMPREFDSYDPFGGSPEGNFQGDGVLAKVLLNGKPIWPPADGSDESWWASANGWIHVANAKVRVPLRAVVDVAAGDVLRFVLNRFGAASLDETAFDPALSYEDGESHLASAEFGAVQGGRGWSYEFAEGPEKFSSLACCAATNRWTKPGMDKSDPLFIAAGSMSPGAKDDVSLSWKAPKAGRVRISADLADTGNPPVPGGGRSFRMGSGIYAPWAALLNGETGQGLFVGWDYFGHWASAFSRTSEAAVNARFRVAGYDKVLQPGEGLTTPGAFAGFFQKDLDEAGNECLDWQYRYLWDYTRAEWFPAIRMLGWWWKGTPWGEPGNAWTGGNGDWPSLTRKIFRVADLMSQTGADVYHRDWGWWDKAGDWNGPDFRKTGAYLRKYGMGQLIYAFIYTVAKDSGVARAHPDWLSGETLDMSKPEVVAYLKNLLDEFYRRFGPFEWRNDSIPTVQNPGDTPLLGQDQGLREIIRDFLDKHPDCAFQGVNGGGNNAGYDYARYASSISFSDGGVGILRNQWASLVLPPDKTSDIPDIWQPEQYDRAIWRGLLTINFDMTGDTWDPAKTEGLRILLDIYHYLGSQGVVGRGVRVYRPLVEGDEPQMFFERLSADGKRGIIIPKRRAARPVTIRPKGLIASENYLVGFEESKASETRTGADLMAKGIKIEAMEPGELIYLNLPYHPGNALDKVPPSPPSEVRKAFARNLDFPGIELTWTAGKDDRWVSYYEILRDGAPLGKAAKGTFYFDHSAGADIAAVYEIRTVDGAGLRSGAAAASGPGGARALVLDDTAKELTFAGRWTRERDLPPAHRGTLARSDEKGARISFDFAGATLTVFVKMGPEGGTAELLIDGKREAVFDTYSADDLWGIGIHTAAFPAAGRHAAVIRVLGEKGGPRAKGVSVAIDGVRVEPVGRGD